MNHLYHLHIIFFLVPVFLFHSCYTSGKCFCLYKFLPWYAKNTHKNLSSCKNSSSCRGWLTLGCAEIPWAIITIESPQQPFYSGDTVTLRCDIAQDGHWEYHWMRNDSRIHSSVNTTFNISLPDGCGLYQCYGARGHLQSGKSPNVTVSFQGMQSMKYSWDTKKPICFKNFWRALPSLKLAGDWSFPVWTKLNKLLWNVTLRNTAVLCLNPAVRQGN